MKSAEILLNDAKIELTNVSNVSSETIDQFMKADTLFFDTETTGFSPWKNEIALIQLYDRDSKKCLLARVPENWTPDTWLIDLF